MPRGRHLAIAGAALVAGAFEAAHQLAWAGRVDVAPIAFAIVEVAIMLELLTIAYARRRSFVLSFALAIGLGIATRVAAWLVTRELGAAIAIQLGAFDGITALGLWAVAIVIPSAVRDANARELEAEKLRTAAELATLRANLQPHFLLNTLSTVSGLVTEDPREARNLVGALGDLLRDSLENGDEMQTLADEIAWLQRYAKILEIRHRGSLAFRWDIADGARGVKIPRLILQPLLENAVKHGALRRRDGGEVHVCAELAGARVRCIVEDNGPGPIARRDGGRGLELVTRRLELGYLGAASFKLETDAGRTRSIVEVPA